MKKILSRRLKIVEQMIIVVLCAVIVPMVISGFIINNINQQAMRSQLRDSAVLISQVVSNEIDVFIKTSINELKQIQQGTEQAAKKGGSFPKKRYLTKVLADSPEFKSLELINTPQELLQRHDENLKSHNISIYTTMDNGKFLVGTFDLDFLSSNLFKPMQEEARQIYVISSDGNLIAKHNYKEKDFKNSIKLLPKKLETDKPVVYGSIKNQPLVYIKKSSPNITIIVNTTKKVTQRSINDNRLKIILAILVASLTIIFIVGLYTYHIYINIRQLFKAIIAVSKGNYQRRIRLLTNIFTPYEIIFLAFKFNRMAGQIHKSYLQLKSKNAELKNLDNYRSNLIDTVSHEFRTPLTSIQGYTSRLLRQDIEIDEETKQKSLRTIKRQSERLSRMIEDLLVVPDIEGARIWTKLEPLVLNQFIESAATLVDLEDMELINCTDSNYPKFMADKDRFEQVLVNLFENAKKYAQEGTPLVVDSIVKDGNAQIYVKNQCEIIPEEKLNQLFDKFTRIDDKTTRTTRGTGLGLFIVKGLVEAMNGRINLYSNEQDGFCVELIFPLAEIQEG